MNSSALFTSASFGIGDYQITCSIEEKSLKITVSSLEPTNLSVLNLSSFISSKQAISFWVSRRIQTEYQPVAEINGETANSSLKNEFLWKKLEQLQRNYRSLENKMQIYADQRKDLWKLRKNQINSKFTPNQSSSLGSTPKKIKNQLSSNILGDIITEKEQQIFLLQRKVNERDELVVQLADGLMAANHQKEEIFNEYQQMLQAVVFQKSDEALLVPIIFKEETSLRKSVAQQVKDQIFEAKQAEKTDKDAQKKENTKDE